MASWDKRTASQLSSQREAAVRTQVADAVGPFSPFWRDRLKALGRTASSVATTQGLASLPAVGERDVCPDGDPAGGDGDRRRQPGGARDVGHPGRRAVAEQRALLDPARVGQATAERAAERTREGRLDRSGECGVEGVRPFPQLLHPAEHGDPPAGDGDGPGWG